MKFYEALSILDLLPSSVIYRPDWLDGVYLRVRAPEDPFLQKIDPETLNKEPWIPSNGDLFAQDWEVEP